MKRAIVTGANGFIGSNLCKKLSAEGCEVIAVVRDKSSDITQLRDDKNIKIVFCDMNNYDLLTDKIEPYGFDAFYHLAWRGVFHGDKSDYVLQVDNCKNAVEAAKASKTLKCKKFISTGTMSEFPVDEMIEKKYFAPNFIYAASKSYLYKLLTIFCEQNDINLVWAILANTYGKGNLTGNVISYIMKAKEEGKAAVLGKGDFYYDFVYIKDCVEMLYLLGKTQEKGSFYVGSGKAKLLREFFVELGEIIGAELCIGGTESQTIEYKKEWFDMENTIKTLGYVPRYDFREGIKDMMGKE